MEHGAGYTLYLVWETVNRETPIGRRFHGEEFYRLQTGQTTHGSLGPHHVTAPTTGGQTTPHAL